MIPLRDTIPSHSTPIVTILIIVVNTVVFLFELMLDPYSRNEFIAVFGAIPDRLNLVSLVTSMFLHGGFMHLIGNMWFLWIYGDNVEDTLGHGRFAFFYILCGLAATLSHVALNPDSRMPMVGASGAIAGVMGAYLLKFPHSRILTLLPIFIFFTTIEVPATFILLYWFVIQIFSGVGTIGTSQVSGGGVAWFAHVGGFITGMLLIKIMRTREPYHLRRDLYW